MIWCSSSSSSFFCWEGLIRNKCSSGDDFLVSESEEEKKKVNVCLDPIHFLLFLWEHGLHCFVWIFDARSGGH